MAKDRTPDDRRTGATRSGAAPGTGRGKGGRTRPVATVVAPQRPWGLIIASILVVAFAAAVITYAWVQVERADAGKVESADEIAGVQTFQYGKGQDHVTTPVDYAESPPVGGPHDGVWADCTGTVYDVNIRDENAVHSLEHGALWITYDPAVLSEEDIATLNDLVSGVSGRMLSPRPGLATPISLQAWDNQLAVDSATDPRVRQFADFFTFNPESTPEPGATCERPEFLANPIVDDGTGTP